MKIRILKINNFRGIKFFDANFPTDIICLFGPCDSTKTTILDAIDYCISPRWNLHIDDSDFYNGDIKKDIIIETTLVDIPDSFLSDKKFGLYLRGWDQSNNLLDEPDDSCKPALTIRLKITNALEPEWTIVNDRTKDPPRISSSDRENLGLSRVGNFADRDFTWSRGTILSQLTGKVDNLQSVLTTANREARNNTNLSTIEKFVEAAKKAYTLATKIGVQAKNEFQPQFDTKSFFGSVSSISLFDGSVPIRLAGLGTKNLISLSIALETFINGAMILIDEIERGLEPFRIRHLLREFNSVINATEQNIGQVFFTTHSPIAMTELNARCYYMVRSKEGVTEIQKLDTAYQDIIRAAPEGLLSRRVIVCEGKTEFGICKKLDVFWQTESNSNSFAYRGISLIDGTGSTKMEWAKKIKQLGYDVLLFIDSDDLDKLSPSVDELKEIGVDIIYWAGTVSTEERVFLDLPFSAVIESLKLAIENFGEETITTHLKNNGIASKLTEFNSVTDLYVIQYDDAEIRELLGKAAKKYKWYKRIDYGESLCEIIIKNFTALEDKNLKKEIDKLKEWAFDN